MNGMYADIIVAAILLIFAVVGFKRGFIKSIASTVSLVASFVLAWMISPAVADFLILLGVKEQIYEKVSATLGSGGAESLSALPEAVSNAIMTGQADVLTKTAISVAEICVNIIAFVSVLIIVRILIWILVKTLNLIAKLPVISFFNRSLGLVFGAAQGILVVFILMTVLQAVVPMQDNPKLMQTIENSYITKTVYENNPITRLIYKDKILTETENEYGEATT